MTIQKRGKIKTWTSEGERQSEGKMGQTVMWKVEWEKDDEEELASMYESTLTIQSTGNPTTAQMSVSSVLSVKASVDDIKVKLKWLSGCSQCCCKRWWKRWRFFLSSPISQDDWWQPTSTQKYYHLPSKIGVFCKGWHDAPMLWCHGDYFCGKLEALFSPFLYWWWRRCLLWPPVWWCILHLHNVSVRTREDQRRGELFSIIMILVSFLTLGLRRSHTREKATLSRK